MGQTSSTSLPSSLPNFALHCLRVAEASPTSDLIEPFFDYLVGIASEEDAPDLSPADLARILEQHEGRTVVLRVYNAKSQRIRGTFNIARIR